MGQVASSPANGELRLVAIERFVVAENELRLDYRVNNILSQDIWVCEDASIWDRNDRPTVQARIMGETLWIRFHFEIPDNISTEEMFARYRRLPAGQSRPGTVLLPLPVVSNFPADWLRGFDRPKEPAVLRRVVFEVGYFAEDLPALVSQGGKRGWLVPGLHYWQPKSSDPNIVLMGDWWQGRHLEQSVQATIDDVNIPAEVLAGSIRAPWGSSER
jgi:hypothetical protein